MDVEFTTTGEAETVAAGVSLGRGLGAGAVVLLQGPLGAGKTAFARGVTEGLGGDPDEVSSPTFTIIQEYSGRVRVHHIDLYRLTPPEVDDLALEELLADGVLVVEWPDRWGRAPADAIVVELERVSPIERRVLVRRAPDATYRDSTR
jgi:tRNA threonylcarbamoyl adenosine modification protein YjeE